MILMALISSWPGFSGLNRMEKIYWVFIALTLILSFSIVLGIVLKHGAPHGTDFYYHLRFAEKYAQGEIAMFNPQLMESNQGPYPPLFHLLLTPATAFGFGIQVGLYSYLKSMVKVISPGMVATSGVTSGAAMISCCTHYLVNLLPILGAVGIITVISQYQVQVFWVGLAFNFAGVTYMFSQVIKVRKTI